MKEYNVITLCGSTKFKEEFLQVQKKLTLQGNIVISVGLFGHSEDSEVWEEGTKEMLDDMHKRKIDMANEIFVINKNGYVGSSTKSEIAYAKSAGKIVRYLEEFEKWQCDCDCYQVYREPCDGEHGVSKNAIQMCPYYGTEDK